VEAAITRVQGSRTSLEISRGEEEYGEHAGEALLDFSQSFELLVALE